MQKTNSAGGNLLDRLGTHFLICTEKIVGKGEDCGLEIFTGGSGIIGVFDGCGGLGSRICSNANGMTEAYLASRAIGSAVRSWFYQNIENAYDWNIDLLRNNILTNLNICEKNGGGNEIKLRGSLVRPFPSTAATVVLQVRGRDLWTKHIWAGDSRTYIINKDGLAQISIDDIPGEDAMSNLSRDSALTNVVSSDNKFVIHSCELILTEPCIILSATDGCFGYVSSPMEFEKILLESLVAAENADEWKKMLANEISIRSGDDQTIAITSFKYDTFDEMKKYYFRRYKYICDIVDEFNRASAEEKQKLWQYYKPQYYRYLSE